MREPPTAADYFHLAPLLLGGFSVGISIPWSATDHVISAVVARRLLTESPPDLADRDPRDIFDMTLACVLAMYHSPNPGISENFCTSLERYLYEYPDPQLRQIAAWKYGGIASASRGGH